MEMQIAQFIEQLRQPLAISMFAFFVYLCGQVTNILLGIGVAKTVKEESFSFKKMITGIFKGLLVGLSVVGAVATITGLAIIVKEGFDVPFNPDEVGVSALVILFGTASVLKLREILKKFAVFSGYKDIKIEEEEEVTPIIVKEKISGESIEEPISLPATLQTDHVSKEEDVK